MNDKENQTDEQSIETPASQIKHNSADEMQDREWKQHPGGG